MAGELQYRRDIDGLRAIAVLAVCFCHAGLPSMAGGYVGVDIFFVISGYLIIGILAREAAEGRFSILAFYERRARRILPALLVMLATLLLVGLWLFPPILYEDLALSMLATLTFLSNLWFWRETGDYFSADAEFQPLLHTWSLGVEEQVYLVLPLLIWVFGRRRQMLIGGISALSVAAFLGALWATAQEPSAAFYLTPFRIWEFGIGGLLALRVLPGPGPRLAGLVAAAGLAGILLPIGLYSAATPFPGIAAVPVVLGTGAIIWAGTGQGGAVTRWLGAAPLVGIGRISYSLYLWHWPPLAVAASLTGSAHLPLPLALGLLVLSAGLAWVSWVWIEQPVRRSGHGRTPVFVASAAACLALGLPAGLIAKQDGIVGHRLPPEVIAIYDEATRTSALEQRCQGQGGAAFDVCSLGDPDASASLLVWGDSHAGTFLPGFDDWLAGQGRAGAGSFKAACGPLAGIDRADMGARHDCAGFNDAVFAWLEAHPEVDTVVLAARWRLIVEGARAPGEAGIPAVLTPVSGPATAQGAEAGNRALAEAGLTETLMRLTELGREVLLIDTVPEMGSHVPRVWLASHYPLGALLEAAPLDLDRYRARTGDTQALLHDIAGGFANVRILPVAGQLCQPGCRTSINGVPAYRDDDHLSAEAARWLVPRLMAPAKLTQLTPGRVAQSPSPE